MATGRVVAVGGTGGVGSGDGGGRQWSLEMSGGDLVRGGRFCGCYRRRCYVDAPETCPGGFPSAVEDFVAVFIRDV